MSPSVHVRLLGEFSVTTDGVAVSGLNSARLQSLLAYLLLHRTSPQSRQQLAFLFWPDTTDRQAQTNLRQLLHILRRRLPVVADALLVDDRTIGWRAGAPVRLDVADFEAALARAGQVKGNERLAALEQAAAAYRGALLPDCYDDWIVPERERLAQQHLAALEQGVLLHEERREYAQAIDWARRLLAADPLHEATYRRLMRLHALNHDRVAAMRVYHTCVSLLEQELGVPPSAATRELYERLVNAAGDATAPAVAASGGMRESRGGLVGRQREWQALQAAWRTANRGAVQCVVLSGEAGIGKTRLAEEMVHWASQQGIAAAVARAYASGRDLAYAAVVECLRSEQVAPLVRRLDPVWRTELARLLPELNAEDPHLPRPEPLSERWQRQRLFEALARVFVADNRPLVLALDDMQWYASETLEWLAYLVRFQPRARLLIIGSLRDDEIDADHPMARLLLDLRSANLLSELALTALSAEETADLAAQLAEYRLDEAAARGLYRFTEGNPLFVVETVRAELGAAGSTQPNGSPAPGAPGPALPPRVQSVIQARLAQLSSEAGDLAGLAATIGRSFTYDVLSRTWEQSPDALVRALDELWQRHIVREQGANAYDFSHGRIRDVAYGDISPARRRLLHRRVAQALETLESDGNGALAVQLAHHFEYAGMVGEAIHYLQQAAATARRLSAHRESIAHLDHGIDLLHSLPATTATLERELDLQMALCQDWGAVTNYLGDETRAVYERALALSRQLRFTPHLFTVYWGLHEIALYRGNHDESLELSEQCMHIAQELDDPGLLLQAHHALWGTYHFSGKLIEALDHMAAGLALYQYPAHEALSPHYGAHDAACCALGTGGLSLWHLGLLDQTVERQQQLLRHADRLVEPVNKADGYLGVAYLHHLLRAPEQAQPYAETVLRIGIEHSHPGIRSGGEIVLGWSLAMQGRPEKGLPLIEQGLVSEKASGFQLNMSQKMLMLAEAYLAASQPDAAMAASEWGIDEFARSRDLICAPDLWTLKGDAVLLLGAPNDEAAACYQVALTLARETGAKTSELRAATRLARLRHRQGRADEGALALREIYTSFTEGRDTPDLRAAANALTMTSSTSYEQQRRQGSRPYDH